MQLLQIFCRQYTVLTSMQHTPVSAYVHETYAAVGNAAVMQAMQLCTQDHIYFAGSRM